MIVRRRNRSLAEHNTTIVKQQRHSMNLYGLSSLLLLLVLTLCQNEGEVLAFTPSIINKKTVAHQSSATMLLAVKKKMNAAAAAALAAIDQVEGKQQQQQQQQQQPSWMDDDEDESGTNKLSKKDLKKALASKKGKAVNVDDVVANIKTVVQQTPPEIEHTKSESKHDGSNGKESHNDSPVAVVPTKSKKELMLEKALELERADVMINGDDESTSSPYKQEKAPKLSAKELKALKKKEEKMAAKLEKKAAKKNGVKESDDDVEEDVEEDGTNDGGGTVDLVNGDATSDATTDSTTHEVVTGEVEAEVVVETITLEDKIRKERPPPRIRVMENTAQGFTSLRLENVGITFRNQQVLNDVTWGVQTGDRIGLVGANGAGKTTQIRILAGELEPTTGDVVKSSKDVRTAVLRQEFIDELVPDRTLREEFASVFEVENQILNDIKATEYELENTPSDDVEKMQEILDRMQELQNAAEDKAVYTLDSRIKKIMDLMGFTDDEGDDLVASFSGGWKMRIGLGKALLREPSVLLLDEPTNHMDLNSVEWLEAFLRQQNIPMVIVSHDREFLDQVCNKIVDAEMGVCTEYNGNYSRFLQLKKTRMESWQAAYNAQEKKIQEERRWIQKFKITQAQTAKQREAKLEKLIKSDEYVKRPPFVGKPFKFRFPDAPRLSPEVAEIKGLSHSYSNDQTRNRLFDNAELFISKGDRIAIVGPNGSGKSTLLRLLIGREQPDEGVARIIGQNVIVSYFEQNQADALDLDKTVLETIQSASRGQSYNELRALLGQFLFKGDAVDKKVESLSGGEKARLSLCCMMLSEHNLLILDEPTNHLDIQSKEMMEEALMNYAGSVIVVSHDRYFISRVATTIVAIEDKKLVRYEGDYKSYMERSEDFKEKIESRFINGVTRIEAAPVIRLDELEAPIKKKNFGGAATAGLVSRKNKGIKNAKRMEAR